MLGEICKTDLETFLYVTGPLWMAAEIDCATHLILSAHMYHEVPRDSNLIDIS